MDTYFSGVDMDELDDNVPNHDIYFSIIVNNKMEIEAKIAFIGETSYSIKARNEDGVEYNKEVLSDKKILYIYNCEIIKPELEISTDFKAKVKSLLATPSPITKTYGSKTVGSTAKGKTVTPAHTIKPKPGTSHNPYMMDEVHENWNNGWSTNAVSNPIDNSSPTDLVEPEFDIFYKEIMLLGEYNGQTDLVQDLGYLDIVKLHEERNTSLGVVTNWTKSMYKAEFIRQYEIEESDTYFHTYFDYIMSLIIEDIELESIGEYGDDKAKLKAIIKTLETLK